MDAFDWSANKNQILPIPWK